MPTKRKTKLVRVPATTNNITKGIINYINHREGCFAFRVNNGGVYDPVKEVFRTNALAGISDIVACVRGKFLAIEVKNELTKDRIKPAQAIFYLNISEAQGEYMVATSYGAFVSLFETIYGR